MSKDAAGSHEAPAANGDPDFGSEQQTTTTGGVAAAGRVHFPEEGTRALPVASHSERNEMLSCGAAESMSNNRCLGLSGLTWWGQLTAIRCNCVSQSHTLGATSGVQVLSVAATSDSVSQRTLQHLHSPLVSPHWTQFNPWY